MPLIGKMIIIGVLIFLVIVMAIVVFGLYLYRRDGREVFYRIDYDGCRDRFKDARSMYKAGQNVTVYYKEKYIATDTDYSFYLDGERLNGTFVKGKGIKLSFTMPDHDVKLCCSAKNSMVG